MHNKFTVNFDIGSISNRIRTRNLFAFSDINTYHLSFSTTLSNPSLILVSKTRYNDAERVLMQRRNNVIIREVPTIDAEVPQTTVEERDNLYCCSPPELFADNLGTLLRLLMAGYIASAFYTRIFFMEWRAFFL